MTIHFFSRHLSFILVFFALGILNTGWGRLGLI
jgi:hypothetical protein